MESQHKDRKIGRKKKTKNEHRQQ